MTDSSDAVADSPDGAADSPEEASERSRSEETDAFWSEVRVDPVKVALPGMVGYTLRAHRPAGELSFSAAEIEGRDEADDIFAERERARAAEQDSQAAQEEALAEAAVGESESRERDGASGTGGGPVADDDGEPSPEEFADEDKAEESPAGPSPDEEVPVFLARDGKLLLFSSPEALVAFVGAAEPHDLTQLDTWTTLVERIRPEDVVAREEDTYELDLVVENLRGGHDAWDLALLVSAGEFARDVGWALRLTPVMTALSPGSPLDDLDEALRSAAAGGFGGFFARRRLRRFGAQQASLGWRTVIGKISGAVDWRD